MLTEIQQGGIRNHIGHCLSDLTRYLRKVGRGGEIAAFLQVATEDNYVGKRYQVLSSEVSLKESIPIIQYELWGMLHADWEILNRLEIINGRKDVKVTAEELTTIAPEIREFSRSTMADLVADVRNNMTRSSTADHTFDGHNLEDKEPHLIIASSP